MMKLKDFSRKYDYPVRAIRYFMETKLTKGKHYKVRGGRIVLPQKTQELIHQRFKARRDYPISYNRINSEFGYRMKELKEFTKKDEDYILIGQRYHFTNEGYQKVKRYKEGEPVNQQPRRVTESLPTTEVTRLSNYSEMSTKEKHNWADKIGLSKEVRDLLFK